MPTSKCNPTIDANTFSLTDRLVSGTLSLPNCTTNVQVNFFPPNYPSFSASILAVHVLVTDAQGNLVTHKLPVTPRFYRRYWDNSSRRKCTYTAGKQLSQLLQLSTACVTVLSCVNPLVFAEWPAEYLALFTTTWSAATISPYIGIAMDFREYSKFNIKLCYSWEAGMRQPVHAL